MRIRAMLGPHSGAFLHHEVDITPENEQQFDHTVYRFAVDRMVDQAIELGRRGALSSDDLSPAQGMAFELVLGGKSQMVEQQIPDVAGILVVLQHLVHED